MVFKIKPSISGNTDEENTGEDRRKLIVKLEEIQTRMGQLCYCCKAQSFQR